MKRNTSYRRAVRRGMLLAVVNVVARTARTAALVLPGNVSWLGNYSVGDGTPNGYTRFLPLSYVLLGSGGVAVVRVITTVEQDCPSFILVNTSMTNASVADNVQIPFVQLRATGDLTLPYAFPIRVCDARLTTDSQKAAWNTGGLRWNHTKLFNAKPIIIPSDPQRYLWLSDTGLRSRPYDLGLGEQCSTLLNQSSNENWLLYGVPQCPINLTQAQLDPSTVTVDAQGTDEWPLTNLIKRAAQQQPDVVVYAGGAIYRQGPCPSASGVNCTGINGGGYVTFQAAQLNSILLQSNNGTSLVANFWPGHWGDNWFGWWADFFFPTKVLLRVAPWIVTPSDLESSSCQGAASRGFYLFLSTEDYPNNTRAGDACQASIEPYAVPFQNEQIVVMDSSRPDAVPDDDSFNPSPGQCPDYPSDNVTVLEATANSPFEDASTNESAVQADLSRLQGYWDTVRNISESHSTNFLLSHRPVYGVQCWQSQWISTDWELQASVGTNDSTTVLERIAAIFSGHQHLLQALEFENQVLPTQITVGHGGTKLLREDQAVSPDLFSDMVLQLGQETSDSSTNTVPIERGIASSAMHGFAIMDRNAQYNYDVTFLSLDTVANAMVKLNFPLTISKGPRTVNVPSSAPSMIDPSQAPTKASPPTSKGNPNGISTDSGIARQTPQTALYFVMAITLLLLLK